MSTIISAGLYLVGVLSVIASYQHAVSALECNSVYWLFSITFFVSGVYCLSKGFEGMELNA